MNESDCINELLERLEEVLLNCWQETGFGHVAVESERVSQSVSEKASPGHELQIMVVDFQPGEGRKSSTTRSSAWPEKESRGGRGRPPVKHHALKRMA